MNAMPGNLRPVTAERRAWPRWAREPVVHFLVIGGLLLAASTIWQWLQPADAIIVDDARVAHLVALYRLQAGRDPRPAEREFLIQNFIKEEALSREARALGLDRDDAIVRRRLVQKMEFLEPDVAGTPRDAELRRFYNENRALFVPPADIGFSQLYFSPDTAGPAAAQTAAHRALAALTAGAAPAALASDSLPVMIATRHQSPDALVRNFGDSAIVATLRTAPLGRWTGPVASGFGWHVVRVDQRTAGAMLSFEDNRAAILAAWQKAATKRARAERLDALLARYPVIRSDAAERGGKS